MKNRSCDPKRRVVITGLGVVSSIGIGVEEFWENLIAGKSGISFIESFDTSNYSVHKGGEVKNFKPGDFIDKRKINYLGRASQMAIAAAKLAFTDSALNIRDIKQMGIFMGTTMGESPLLEEMDVELLKGAHEDIKIGSVFLFPANIIPVSVALEFAIHGYNYMIPNACSASNFSIGYAFDLIRNGRLDFALCGSSDAFAKTAFVGFNRLLAMAPEKCQPFDLNRKGMMLGEGAALLTLEPLDEARARGAKIYAELLGYGISCDASHMTQPSGEGIVKCLERALLDADISTSHIDYINAHGTGTIQNDRTECAALRQVFKEDLKRIPCSSIKSMLGHTMGSASAMEAAATCLAIKNGIIPPTINFETPDPECEIDCVPNFSKKKTVRVAFSNSFAFGGNNCVIVLGKI